MPDESRFDARMKKVNAGNGLKSAWITGLAIWAGLFAPQARAESPSKHVVIVVMDGLRPDSVNADDMPTLAALGKSGVFFKNHHPAFLSSTEVNGAALATGVQPGRNGVVANEEFRPEIELLQPVHTQDEFTTWKGDKNSNGRYLAVPTLPEILRQFKMRSVVAGTKGVAYLWNRSAKGRQSGEITIYEGKSVPSAALDDFSDAQGPIPPKANPKHNANASQDRWTTKVLTESLWADEKGGVPALSVLWLSEPDYSQHGSGPGSKTARQALRSSDDCLKSVLEALEKKGVRRQTDVLVVSDHGFSTIGELIDVQAELKKAGIKVSAHLPESASKAQGHVLVVGLGGTVNLYVVGHDPKAIGDVVKVMQESSFAGVLFTKEGRDGTFKLADVGLDSADAPDVVMSLRWSDEEGAGGMKGTILSEGNKHIKGQGNHASLSRWDMHNTLIAAGPDFRAGLENMLPSANIDVAPTVLKLLGLKLPAPGRMDGRVLEEALSDGKAPAGQMEKTTLVARRETGTALPWRQYLKVIKFAGRTYYIEGNVGEGDE